MKKLNQQRLQAVKGGACLSPAAPHLGDCPGFCHASQIVFQMTGSGIGVNNAVCIV
jgi:hypothetical protein